MKISCEEAKILMEKRFRNRATDKDKAKIKKHCENCEMCKVLFYNLQDTNPNISDAALNSILDDNKDVTRRRKIRKRIIISCSAVIVLVAIFITSFIFLDKGKVVYFADVDYGNSSIYAKSTNNHPSYEEVQNAMKASKYFFNEIGSGCILTSLRYNPTLTYNEKKGYDKAIVVDFSYIRVYPVNGSTNSYFTNNDNLSFVYIPKQTIKYEQTRGFKDEKD